jgi:hypothetical protein
MKKTGIHIAVIGAITVGYARGADPISCNSPITRMTQIMDMRLVRQYFDDWRKLWIAVYEAVDGRQCEVPQTFAEAMRTEWTSVREWPL